MALAASTAADECACATEDVNIRDGIGTAANVLGVLQSGKCVPYIGDRGTDEYDATWVKVDYNSQVSIG